jgi:hypothetical protein
MSLPGSETFSFLGDLFQETLSRKRLHHLLPTMYGLAAAAFRRFTAVSLKRKFLALSATDNSMDPICSSEQIILSLCVRCRSLPYYSACDNNPQCSPLETIEFVYSSYERPW